MQKMGLPQLRSPVVLLSWLSITAVKSTSYVKHPNLVFNVL